MARLEYEVQAVRDRDGDLATGVAYQVYTDEAGTLLADISATSGGSAIAGSTVTVADIAGLGPSALRWWGPPAGTDELYLKTASDPTLPVQKVEAVTDQRLDALEAALGGTTPSQFARRDQANTFTADNTFNTDVSFKSGRPWADPRAHGAAGDGANNDTVAFHAARDAAGVDGQVLVTEGTYLVDGLALNVAGQRWSLAAGATIKLKNAGNAHVVTISAADVTVEGGEIDGNKTNQTTAGAGIFVSSVADVTVRGVRVGAAYSYGVWAFQANRVRVEGVRVTDSGYIGIAVQADSAAGADMVDPTVEGCTVDRTGIAAGSIVQGGLKVLGATPRRVLGAKVHGCTVRLPTSPTDVTCIGVEAWGGAPYSSIKGNHTFGGSMGVSCSTADHASVQGNIVFGPGVYGLECAETKYAAYTGNTVDGNALPSTGISVSVGGSTSDTFTGNTIRNLAASGRALHAVSAGKLTITGNTFLVPASGTGVYLQTVQHFTVTGNRIEGSGSDAVVLETSWSGTVSGNELYNFTRSAVFFYGTTAVTFVNVTMSGNTLVSTTATTDRALSGGAALGSAIVVKANAGETRDWWDLANNVLDAFGSGTPEGAVTAGVGSTYRRSDGGAGTIVYAKNTGTGNTGWGALT